MGFSSQTLKTSFLLFLSITLLFISPALSADADPLQDLCVADMSQAISVNGFPCKKNTTVTANDFFSSAISKPGDTNNGFGSKVTPANVMTFPGLNTLGLSMNRVDLAVNGLNPPHVHPRATQLGFVVKGVVLVGFVTTDNKYFYKVISAGENFVVPRGLMHFEMNVGYETALEITAFDSQLPGTVSFPLTLFDTKPAIGDDVLAKTFQVDPSIIDKIKSMLNQTTSY